MIAHLSVCWWLGAAMMPGIGLRVANAAPAEAHDTDLTGKVFVGYQGWHLARNDGSPYGGWFHWFQNKSSGGGYSNIGVEMYPDMNQYDRDERYPTEMKMRDGSTAYLYSHFNPKTVQRHFQWMKDYGIDGAFVQRFTHELHKPEQFAQKNTVLAGSRTAAEAAQVLFAVRYDMTGHRDATIEADLQKDWTHLVKTLKITASPNYLRHDGKPVLAFRGFGDITRPPEDPQKALRMQNWFKHNPDPDLRVTLMGTIPSRWRTLGSDSRTDRAWLEVYHNFNIIAPWTPGRYRDEAGVAKWRASQLEPDVAEAKKYNQDYLAIMFPGFSWYNKKHSSSQPELRNKTPRNGGTFLWSQAYHAQIGGATGAFIAMFDEVDEGTAIYKIAPNQDSVPAIPPGVDRYWLTLDADGYKLPSDWYLRVTREISIMFKGTIEPTPTMPLDPGKP